MGLVFDGVPFKVGLDDEALTRWWSGLRPERAARLEEMLADLDPDDDADLSVQLQSIMLVVFGQEGCEPGDMSAADAGVLTVSAGDRVLTEIAVSADLDPSYDTVGLPDGVYACVSFSFASGARDVLWDGDSAGMTVTVYQPHPTVFVTPQADVAEMLRGMLTQVIAEVGEELDRRRRFARRVGALALSKEDDLALAQFYFAPSLVSGAEAVWELRETVSTLPTGERPRNGEEEYKPKDDNRIRAVRAARVLIAYAELLGQHELDEECTTVLADLTSDLMHLADAVEGDPIHMLLHAVGNYDDEVRGI